MTTSPCPRTILSQHVSASLRRTARCWLPGLIAVAGLCVCELRAAQTNFWPANQWPPSTWRFAATNDAPTIFNTPPFATFLRRFELTNLFNPIIPPALSQTNVYSYSSCVLKNERSVDFGGSWQPLQGGGPIQIQLIHAADVGATRVFDLELLQLDIVEPVPPIGVYRIQENIFEHSLGQLVITATNGGYLISGYINVWFDLNVGSSFVPANSSAYLELGGPSGTPAVLSVTDQGAGNVQVCWTTQPDVQYQLQWTDAIASTNWTNLGAALPGTTTNLCMTDSTLGQTNRYYRVRLSP